MNVPRKSHARVFAPNLSPMRPMNAPAMKVSRDVSACLSAMWKEVSRCPGGPENRRARARASWTEFPVWKPHQTKTAEKETESLDEDDDEHKEDENGEEGGAAQRHYGGHGGYMRDDVGVQEGEAGASEGRVEV